MLFVLSLAEFGDDTMSSDELSAIIDKYGQMMLRTAYMYLKDRQRAEDVCQEVFLRLFRDNRTFESDEHQKAFILRVTINLCKDQLKSFWSKRIVLDDAKEPKSTGDLADEVAKEETRRELYDSVLALPEAFKDVVLLYYYEGYNTREISETLGIPDATVRSRLKRARERLMNTLKGGASLA